jgi:hypothetical protein
MMRNAALKALIPRDFVNKRGRPLAIIVHPTRRYDTRATAAKAIQRTVETGHHRFNLLEITQVGTRSYLGLPKHLTSSTPYYGIMLDQEFLQKHHDLFETNTFIFMGGALGRCLLNAIASVLIAKLTPLEKLFAKHRSVLNLNHPAYSHIYESLAQAATGGENAELNLHFNCEAMYYNPRDLARYLPLRWNRPNVIMGSLLRTLRKNLLKYGIAMREYINGAKIDSPTSESKISSARVNLYYWNDASQMEAFFKAD